MTAGCDSREDESTVLNPAAGITTQWQLGIPCAYQSIVRMVQDYLAWAPALATGQQLPAAADEYLRNTHDPFLQ